MTRRAEIVLGVRGDIIELGLGGIDDDQLHARREQLARDLHDRSQLLRGEDLGHESPPDDGGWVVAAT